MATTRSTSRPEQTESVIQADPAAGSTSVGLPGPIEVDPELVDINADPRSGALAALLAPPTSTPSDLNPPRAQRVPPVPTGDEFDWTDGGEPRRRFIMWTEVYARMFGDDRRSARRGDILTLPDDKLTASHEALGHIIPLE